MSKKIALATLSLLPLATINVQAEQIGMVTASTLNVRSGIGKQNKILFTLSKNEKVTIKSSSNGWYKIANSNNKEGWASSQYIKVVEDSVKNTKVVDVDRLNMRSGPSTSYRVLRVLTKGSSVEVISTSNNWSKIKYSGITGYVLDEHLKSNTTVKYINASGVNVRSGPSTSDSILGRLNKNDKVEIISESGSWSKINYKGSTAYVSSQYLSDKKVENDKDEEVKVENKWVTTDNLNVRSGPSTSYSILGKLNKDDKVEVISESGSWSKISYKGSTAYVSSQYLSDKKVEDDKDEEVKVENKWVTTDNLNVRSGPSTSYSILGKLNKDDKVEVISESGSWSKINYKGSTAYVSSQYLSDKKVEDDKDEEVKVSNKKVTASTLNVRSGPSTSHSIIGTLYKGNVVKPLSQDNGWVKIKLNDTTGYISDTYLTNTSESENMNGSNNSSSAGTNYKPLSYTLDQHVEVQYSKALKGGNKIDASLSTGGSGNRGYINATRADLKKYLNPDTFTSSASGMNQFLRLDSYKGGVTVSQLNSYLNSLAPDSNGNNVFYNKGEAFINAAKKSDIDLAYFVAHAMVETGYGRSTLAKGQYVSTPNGQVKVYNFFGIAAFDGTADSSGKNYAYKMGWTSVEKTLEGSAKWIADNYIKNSRYNQNTLYKMRWSYENPNHQYATDVNWAKLIGSVMTKITSMYSSTSMKYEVPKYK